MTARRVAAALGWAVLAIYLVRARDGFRALVAQERVSRDSVRVDDREAVATLRREAIGANRFENLWLGGEALIGIADRRFADGRPPQEGERALSQAATMFLEAAARSPASAWPWNGLAEAYGRSEAAARSRRPFDLSLLGASPWQRVGRAGRIAVGFAREAVAREPSVAAHHDELASLCLSMGLHAEAEAAIRDSARTQPLLPYHPVLASAKLPRDLVEAFAEESRAALGTFPLIPRGTHLVSLGTLGLDLGRPERAEEDLRAALEEPLDSLARAEAAYYLGLALRDLGRDEDAVRSLLDARREAVFRLPVAVALAAIEEKRGNLRAALDHLEEARRLDAANPVWRSLEVARLAAATGAYGRAESVLQWAILTHPEAMGARVALVRVRLAAANREGARAALAEAARWGGETPEIARLREEIARAPARGERAGAR